LWVNKEKEEEALSRKVFGSKHAARKAKEAPGRSLTVIVGCAAYQGSDPRCTDLFFTPYE
jgi:hypothetical protein